MPRAAHKYASFPFDEFMAQLRFVLCPDVTAQEWCKPSSMPIGPLLDTQKTACFIPVVLSVGLLSLTTSAVKATSHIVYSDK